jgi:hypothetical protein
VRLEWLQRPSHIQTQTLSENSAKDRFVLVKKGFSSGTAPCAADER